MTGLQMPAAWREKMILVIDVGNTNITCGVFEGKKLTTTFRMMSRASHTSDEYGILLRELLRHNRIDREKLTGAIIASVGPNVMHALTGAIKRYLELDPLIVGNGIKTGIRITAENPKEIGPDRIVDVVAAYEKYGGPVLVLDFGTATTYDLVTADGKFGVGITEKGEFTAGITAPGIRISAEALWNGAARLPEIEIRKPASILARETVSSMQAGLVYGQIGQTEYIIRQVKKETGLTDLKVVATGGLGRIIADETDAIDIYDSSLTLEGLRILYERNRKSTR